MPGQTQITGLFGLVVCGGKSMRMGTDKGFLLYHDKPQCFHLYEMLLPLCERVFVSCNNSQEKKIEPGYSTIIDLPGFEDTGPMAGLLSAFDHFPKKNFLMIGCDYPFLAGIDLLHFINSFDHSEKAAAFYNASAELYEPLLAFYNQQTAEEILAMHADKDYSLQHHLQKNHAFKFYPRNLKCIESVDTEPEFENALKIIRQTMD